MKTRYTLLTGFLVASVLCGTGYVIHQQAYDAGKQAERKDWQFEWSKRDEADRTAQLKQEKEQRNEELRRQKETQEIINHAEQEKQKPWLMPLLLMMLLTGCAEKLPVSGVNSQPVRQAAFPQMPPEGRQPPRPQICLPTCTKSLTAAREKSLGMLMQQQAPGESANGHMKR